MNHQMRHTQQCITVVVTFIQLLHITTTITDRPVVSLKQMYIYTQNCNGVNITQLSAE